MSLYIGKNHQSNAPVQSIFRLIGNDEDALTYALGYLLAHDQSFCAKLTRLLGVAPRQAPKLGYSIRLQEVTDPQFGRRDIVLEGENTRIVLEAKVGGAEPTAQQLRKYADEGELWSQYKTRAVVALTRGGLSEATRNEVVSKLSRKKISFSDIQWGQIVELVLRHRPDSPVTKYLFNEFIRYIRSDYDMGYHDAEIEIQDTDLLNATIYNKGWMYVGSAKNAPLYFAPYFTKQVVGKKSDSGIANGMDHGIAMISRVKDTVVVKNADIQSINPNSIPGIEKQRGKWAIGLHEIQKRVESEGWEPDKELRLLFLDRPVSLLKPITKDAWNKKDPPKNIPKQIPKGFSLQFDELLTGIEKLS